MALRKLVRRISYLPGSAHFAIPLKENNFFLSQLRIASLTYRMVFVCIDLHLVLRSQSQSRPRSLQPFRKCLIQQVSCKIDQVLFKITAF